MEWKPSIRSGAEWGAPREETDQAPPLSGSNEQGLSLTFDLAYEIGDSMTVNAGIGTRQIHEGTNLPWGFALMGKNVKYGRSFGLGFKAEF